MWLGGRDDVDDNDDDRFLYSAILRSRADSLRSHVILHEWLAFYSAFLNIHRSGVLAALAWLVPHETAAVSARSVYTIQPCTMSLHAKMHNLRCMRVLAVTCHLHFWRNDRDLLRATAVTRGWNGYRNKSQHRKLSLEKKIIPPHLQGFEPAIFHSRVRRSNHWAFPVPGSVALGQCLWCQHTWWEGQKYPKTSVQFCCCCCCCCFAVRWYVFLSILCTLQCATNLWC